MPVVNVFDTGGINQSLPHTKINRNEFVQLDNFMLSTVETNAAELVSFIQKAPSKAAYLDRTTTGTASNGRGLYQFESYAGGTLYTVYATSSGDIVQSGSTTWNSTKLISGLTSGNHVEFSHWYRKESKDVVCAMTDGSGVMYKWNPADTTAGYLYNKSGESSGVLTGILTFTKGSDQVTGSGTAFTTEVQAGDKIRVGDYENYSYSKSTKDGTTGITKERKALWYKVYSVDSATALTLESIYTGETISGGSGTSQIDCAKVTGTLTFTKGSASVTGSGTNFDPEVSAGQWIRVNAKGRWYEVMSITNDTTLVLRTTFKENTVKGTSGGSERALAMTKYRFVKMYDSKGVQKVIYLVDVTNSDYGLWRHSVPGDPEDVPTDNMDRIPGCITGSAQVGNWLIIFTQTNYYAYKYLASIDDYKRIGVGYVGCISSKTICEIPGATIFLSKSGLFKLSIQEGLQKIGDKVQLELDAVIAGVLNSTYYTASGSQTKMPQACMDYETGLFYLSYPLSEAKNSYVLVWDSNKNIFMRWTDMYVNCMIIQRVSGGTSRLIYGTANGDGYTYSLNPQTLANSSLTSGVIKPGYWSFPDKEGKITNKAIKCMVLKIMESADFNGTIALQYWSDWTTGNGNTVSITAWTNTTAYHVKHIVYPINQTCHHIQWKLSDAMTAGGYGIIGIELEYEDGSTQTYGSHHV